MENGMMSLLVIIAFLLVAGRSCSARLLDNDRFNVPANPSALDPSLTAVANAHVEKDAVQCGQELSPWICSSASTSKNSVIEIKKITFRLRPTIQNKKKSDELPASNEAEGVLILMPTGGPNVYLKSKQMTEQRLSASSHSPGVGHMQMIRHKSKSRDFDIIQSDHSNGDHLQQNKRNKRNLRSTPSPGVGN